MSAGKIVGSGNCKAKTDWPRGPILTGTFFLWLLYGVEVAAAPASSGNVIAPSAGLASTFPPCSFSGFTDTQAQPGSSSRSLGRIEGIKNVGQVLRRNSRAIVVKTAQAEFLPQPSRMPNVRFTRTSFGRSALTIKFQKIYTCSGNTGQRIVGFKVP